MKTITMTFTAVHTFTVDDEGKSDDDIQRACKQEAREVEARTGLNIDAQTIDILDA